MTAHEHARRPAAAREPAAPLSSAPARAIVHIGLTVPDLDHAVDWYVRVLGFDVLSSPTTVEATDGYSGSCAREVFGSRFGSMRQAQLVAGNGVGLELFQFITPPTTEPTGFEYWRPGPFHICVRDRDVAGLARKIAESGGRQRTAVHAAFEGALYEWCYCEDPFENIIEIYSHSHEQVYANR